MRPSRVEMPSVAYGSLVSHVCTCKLTPIMRRGFPARRRAECAPTALNCDGIATQGGNPALRYRHPSRNPERCRVSPGHVDCGRLSGGVMPETALVLAADLLGAALAANDRLKYYFTMLQAAQAHARADGTAAFADLRAAREACGIADEAFERS